MGTQTFQKAWLCALTVLFWLAQYIYIPFLTPYLLSLGISATFVGVIVGAYGLTQLLLRIPLGILVDRVGHHPRFILGGAVLAALSSLLMLLFPSTGMLFTANALSGIASSTWISFLILYSGHYLPREQTKALGVLNAFYNLGILLAFLVGGMVLAHSGMRALFLISVFIGAAACGMALFLEGGKGEAVRPQVRQSLAGIYGERRILANSLLGAATFLILFATVFSFTNSTARNLGATGTQLGFFAMLYCLGCVLGSFLLATPQAQRAREGRWLAQGFLVLAVYCICVPFVRDLRYFIPLHLLCGLASGALTSALMAFAVKNAGLDRRTSAMGFYQSINCLGTTLGPVVMGLLIDHSSARSAFLVMGGVGVLCAIAAFLTGRHGTTVGGSPVSFES